MKNTVFAGVIALLILVSVFVFLTLIKRESSRSGETVVVQVPEKATERYRARVDRVVVQFEQWDYVRYRLQTNDLVREGIMNSERGFAGDPDAMVYVLDWHKPAGEQIRYVRLTAEPNFLYMLDSDYVVVQGSKLSRE